MPKVSALAAATLPLTGAETVYVVQGGNSRKSDIDAVMALVPAKMNASGAAPIYACRAWVNFNGTGVVAIRASGNVSSITDNGVGDYTVNFTTAMPDANYCVTGAARRGVTNDDIGFRLANAAIPTTGAVRITTGAATVPVDGDYVNVAIFR